MLRRSAKVKLSITFHLHGVDDAADVPQIVQNILVLFRLPRLRVVLSCYDLFEIVKGVHLRMRIIVVEVVIEQNILILIEVALFFATGVLLALVGLPCICLTHITRRPGLATTRLAVLKIVLLLRLRRRTTLSVNFGIDDLFTRALLWFIFFHLLQIWLAATTIGPLMIFFHFLSCLCYVL